MRASAVGSNMEEGGSRASGGSPADTAQRAVDGGGSATERRTRGHEGEISAGVRDASRKVMERVRQQLEPEAFRYFKEACRQFVAGSTGADAFSQVRSCCAAVRRATLRAGRQPQGKVRFARTVVPPSSAWWYNLVQRRP